jgi:hypothetical protein
LLGSSDNITVLVIDLRWARSPSTRPSPLSVGIGYQRDRRRPDGRVTSRRDEEELENNLFWCLALVACSY